jgi:MFS family permease
MLAHLAVTRADGMAVYVVRFLYTCSAAGAFGASITYVSLRAPESRMAEMIGMLGTSGFFGLALGPCLGDYLVDSAQVQFIHVQRMFLLAASMSAIAIVFAVLGTRQPTPRAAGETLPMLAALRKYYPGPVLVMAAGMGLVLSLPHTFLSAFAAELAIPRIKLFFIVYAAVAMAVRLSTRRLADRIGVRPVILWGMACAIAATLSYLLVASETTLILPAFFTGIAHALLFPAVVAGGNAAFPPAYRGIATTLMLSMFDCGLLFGQPAMGAIIHAARQLHLPPYPTMFTAIAALSAAMTVYYAWGSRPRQKGAGRHAENA